MALTTRVFDIVLTKIRLMQYDLLTYRAYIHQLSHSSASDTEPSRQHGVTTSLRHLLSLERGHFKGLRNVVFLVAATSCQVVEHLDKIKKISPGHVPYFIHPFSSALFKQVDEGLCHGNIPAVAALAHTG